jgi:hypothetical protein
VQNICLLYITPYLFYIVATSLSGQGLEQPSKDLPLKVQKDVAMKHSSPFPSMHYPFYLLNFIWYCTKECFFHFYFSKIASLCELAGMREHIVGNYFMGIGREYKGIKLLELLE